MILHFNLSSGRKFDVEIPCYIVYRFDLTESTASNRIRVYVNNEEVTSWTTTNDPPNNVNIQIHRHRIKDLQKPKSLQRRV